MNTHWFRVGFASLMLAILLRIGIALPILTTLVVVGVIYASHVLYTQLGTGVTHTWSGVKMVARVAMGIVMFLALRYIAAGLLGLYPIDTYESINSSGGLFGILPGRDAPKVIVWEVLFAFVAGGLTVAYVNGKSKMVGTIFAVSLAVLSLQVALPKYTATFPTRDETSMTLVHHGIVGSAVRGLWALFFGGVDDSAPPRVLSPADFQQPAPVHSTGRATALMVDRLTPVCDSMNYSPELDTQGDSVAIRIPMLNGSDTTVKYSGHGELPYPVATRKTGLVCTTSLTPGKEARVRIWRVIAAPTN